MPASALGDVQDVPSGLLLLPGMKLNDVNSPDGLVNRDDDVIAEAKFGNALRSDAGIKRLSVLTVIKLNVKR